MYIYIYMRTRVQSINAARPLAATLRTLKPATLMR